MKYVMTNSYTISTYSCIFFRRITQHIPLIIAGDFNLSDIDWSTLTGGSAVANELCNITFELNLFQHIDQPTHIQGNVLDLGWWGFGTLLKGTAQSSNLHTK